MNKEVLMGVLQPWVLKTDDNPDGVDGSVFDDLVAAIEPDRFAALTAFLADVYNLDELLGERVSAEVVRDGWSVAAGASPVGTVACLPTWITDFRADVAKIDVPTLVVHGYADRILPIDATARRLPDLIAGSELVEIPGAPHGWRRKD